MAKTTTSKREKATSMLKAADFDSSRNVPYHHITITCACGGSYEAGSVLDSLRVDICSNCHPFFTGENRILDTEGRVEKFRKKYAKTN